jgi:uroporphyrin-3 C-methyltransferase
LLALVLLIAAVTWYWLQHQQLRSQLSTLQQASNSVAGELASQRSQLSRLSDSFGQLASQQALALPELQQQTRLLAHELKQLASGTRSDWLLAETEYLMRLANQRMQLEVDARSAEAMLGAADSVLQEIGDPALFPIREQLAQEILALQAVQPIDREQGFARLHALIGMIAQITPGQFTATPETISEPSESAPSVWQAIKADLFKLFRVRRLDQPVAPLMAPEENYYLQQNLRLMLEQSSQALLAGEQSIYQASLDKAGQWLHQYFDAQDPHVKAMLSGISELKQAHVSVQRVDISNSLRLLRHHIESLYRSHQLSRTLPSAEALNEARE